MPTNLTVKEAFMLQVISLRPFLLMPGFQSKYGIEINDDVMGQQGEDRLLAEEQRPGQRGGGELIRTNV